CGQQNGTRRSGRESLDSVAAVIDDVSSGGCSSLGRARTERVHSCYQQEFAQSESSRWRGHHRRHARRMCSPDTFASPREQIGLTRLANPLYPPLSLACEGRFLQNAIERRPKPYCACASTATQGWAR